MGNDIEGKYQKDASIFIFALAEANINRNLKGYTVQIRLPVRFA